MEQQLTSSGRLRLRFRPMPATPLAQVDQVCGFNCPMEGGGGGGGLEPVLAVSGLGLCRGGNLGVGLALPVPFVVSFRFSCYPLFVVIACLSVFSVGAPSYLLRT